MNRSLRPTLADCWAKTDQDSGLPCLSVRDHCLIVGQVASVLLHSLPEPVRKRLPEQVVSLVAAHDIGKVSPGFLRKCPGWRFAHLVNAPAVNETLLEPNHARMSQWHLQSSARFALPREAWPWLVSTGGHHGRYADHPKVRNNINRPQDGSSSVSFQELRDELLATLIETFGPLPTEAPDHKGLRNHLLTGFTIFADWIGSNTDWFPAPNSFPSSSTPDLNKVSRQTDTIMDNLGQRIRVRPKLSFAQLFSPSLPPEATPRPLQQTLLEVADRPGLYLIEAPMGMGKTEAALAAAYQRWQSGPERGLYFALPTQLTSDKIHQRITTFLSNAIGAGPVQTLVHGNAWMRNDQVQRLGPKLARDPSEQRTSEPDHGDTDEPLRWYASSRKTLLAPFGTGTIDQALLAVLPARFAALRYFALAGRIIVIDEVHSYDPYMSALIDRLISMLLPTGATVIVLSATLTAARRASLVAAAGAEEDDSPSVYPLITRVSSGETTATHFTTAPEPESNPNSPVLLRHLTLEPDQPLCAPYWQELANAVLAGANVVIIRNTVALAQQTYRHLKSLLNQQDREIPVGLIHSRFPVWQRRDQEDHWTKKLGKDDTKRPRGSLVVSTQVLEQSVDIDADLLVTDLAPIDLIIQRIGRLHRHPRPRPQGFNTARCLILHPSTDWQGSPREVKAKLGPHGFIYHPLTLWQAQQTLRNRDQITLPADIRPLLEQAAALAPSDDASSALLDFQADYQHLVHKQQGTAQIRDLYDTPADDREGHETRYRIQPSAQLVLLREPPRQGPDGWEIHLHLPAEDDTPTRAHRVAPGQFSYPLARDLARAAVRIPGHLARDLLATSPDWLRHHLDDALCAVVSSDSTRLNLPACYPDSPAYDLHYHPKTGVTYERNEAVPLTQSGEEDWF